MGLLWWKCKDKALEAISPPENSKSKPSEAVKGVNGTVEVRCTGPCCVEATIFEFGSVAASQACRKMPLFLRTRALPLGNSPNR
uniref:Uncharacterized protein n=1 Tax=Chenopodium quinoa TaxID=63459 RepID=A0A803M532_CHEQI